MYKPKYLLAMLQKQHAKTKRQLPWYLENFFRLKTGWNSSSLEGFPDEVLSKIGDEAGLKSSQIDHMLVRIDRKGTFAYC